MISAMSEAAMADDVEDDLEARVVECLDHGLEFAHLGAGRDVRGVAGLGRNLEGLKRRPRSLFRCTAPRQLAGGTTST